MKGYSKINIFNPSHRSRSMDLSDPLTSSEPKKADCQTDIDTKPQEKITSQLQSFKNTLSWLQAEDGCKENSNTDIMFSGIKLKRNSSVSSASYAVHYSAVKKAFSMRRSSSVSEKYCRIHDQSSPRHDDEAEVSPTRSVKRKNSRSRILRACKKLIGL